MIPSPSEVVHDVADFAITTMVGGVVSYWTKNPLIGKIAGDYLGPYVADLVEDTALGLYGNISSYPFLSHPVTSTTGHSQRGYVKKQMSSTSRSHSYRRRKYYYGKKRRFY